MNICGDGKCKTWYGTDSDDLIVGHRINESLYGNGGNDTIIGGLGNDKLYGGAGNDRLDGSVGADSMWGGAGSDTFAFSWWADSCDANNQSDSIRDFAAEDFIDLSSIGALTMDQIEVTTVRPGEYHVCVHLVEGDTRWDMGIDVVGVAPTEANFILAS